MSRMSRYRKEGGLRALVELLEMLPKAKREKIIEFGMQDDPELIKQALPLMIRFEDLLGLSDPQLADVLFAAEPRFIGLSMQALSENERARFLKNSDRRKLSEIKDVLELASVPKREISTACYQLVAVARKLEREGVLNFRVIHQSV